jgi:hypothetical protein
VRRAAALLRRSGLDEVDDVACSRAACRGIVDDVRARTRFFAALACPVVSSEHHDEARQRGRWCVERWPAARGPSLTSCVRAGNKFKMSVGLPVGAVMNCADNTGAKNLYVISVKGEPRKLPDSNPRVGPDLRLTPLALSRLGRAAEPPAWRRAGRHVHGNREEGEARPAQEG